MSNKQRPILITGSHRSGTTWAGSTLASAPGLFYIHEPFNPQHDPGLNGGVFRHWFTYVCADNEDQYYEAVHRVLDLRYDLWASLRLGMTQGLAKSVRRFLVFTRYRWMGARPLLKDPIAFFSAAWLASRFDADVVIMIRHPGAFAGSLKVKGWRHPFADFLAQPLLIRDHLAPFAADIERFATAEQDVVEQAALLWNLIHHVILTYQQQHPDWVFVRHEDLSQDPMGEFRRIFQHVGLPFGEESAKVIRWHSGETGDEGPLRRQHHSMRRDSVANVARWKERLTPDEITSLRRRVDDIAGVFYTEDDWSLHRESAE